MLRIIDYKHTKLSLTDMIWLVGLDSPIDVADAIKNNTSSIDNMRDNGLIQLDNDALCYLVRMRNEKDNNPTGDNQPHNKKHVIDDLFDKIIKVK